MSVTFLQNTVYKTDVRHVFTEKPLYLTCPILSVHQPLDHRAVQLHDQGASTTKFPLIFNIDN